MTGIGFLRVNQSLTSGQGPQKKHNQPRTTWSSSTIIRIEDTAWSFETRTGFRSGISKKSQLGGPGAGPELTLSTKPLSPILFLKQLKKLQHIQNNTKMTTKIFVTRARAKLNTFITFQELDFGILGTSNTKFERKLAVLKMFNF